MKTKLKPVVVGTFVLGGVVLVIVALLSFRSLHLFSKPARFLAYFNESVPGLDVGSMVKFRGVRVGRVSALQVRYDEAARGSLVVVTAELEEKAVRDPSGKPLRFGDKATLQRLIDQGLRAKIGLAGITGMQFVELDLFDPKEFPAKERAIGDEPYAVVPTLRSGMSELVENLSKTANNLNKVDFAGLTHDLQGLLSTLNQQVSTVDLKQLVAKVTAAADAIGTLAGSTEAKSAFANLNKTATDFQGLVTKLDSQVGPVSALLVRSLRSFHDAAESIHQFVGPQSGLGEDADRTLQQVGEAAASLQRLADFLEQNPKALLTGKKRPDKQP
ncbi:MAG TPA: MlaD family protein [Candidatus Limnocylindria bacterium]|nr:MlaD family protein [Candidatus Limnocylindria bacterium]